MNLLDISHNNMASLDQTLLNISTTFQIYLRTHSFLTFDLTGPLPFDYKIVRYKSVLKHWISVISLLFSFVRRSVIGALHKYTSITKFITWSLISLISFQVLNHQVPEMIIIIVIIGVHHIFSLHFKLYVNSS